MKKKFMPPIHNQRCPWTGLSAGRAWKFT